MNFIWTGDLPIKMIKFIHLMENFKLLCNPKVVIIKFLCGGEDF